MTDISIQPEQNTTDVSTWTLDTCEGVIERGLATFVDVGQALARIRDGRLYKETHETFEQYCQVRWRWKASRARQLCAAAAVVGNLKTVTIVTPATESQARPLTKLPPEKQPEAWQRAVETAEAEERRVTAKDVKHAVAEYLPPSEPEKADGPVEALRPKPPSPPAPPADEDAVTDAQPSERDAMTCADLAVGKLQRIDDSTPDARKALEHVRRWIDDRIGKQCPSEPAAPTAPTDDVSVSPVGRAEQRPQTPEEIIHRAANALVEALKEHAGLCADGVLDTAERLVTQEVAWMRGQRRRSKAHAA